MGLLTLVESMALNVYCMALQVKGKVSSLSVVPHNPRSNLHGTFIWQAEENTRLTIHAADNTFASHQRSIVLCNTFMEFLNDEIEDIHVLHVKLLTVHHSTPGLPVTTLLSLQYHSKISQ